MTLEKVAIKNQRPPIVSNPQFRAPGEFTSPVSSKPAATPQTTSTQSTTALRQGH